MNGDEGSGQCIEFEQILADGCEALLAGLHGAEEAEGDGETSLAPTARNLWGRGRHGMIQPKRWK